MNPVLNSWHLDSRCVKIYALFRVMQFRSPLYSKLVTVVEIWYAGEGGARSWWGEKRRFSAWRLLWVLLLEISASSSFILLWEDSCSERKYSYDLNTGPVWWNCVQQGNVVWYSSGSWKTRLNLVPNLSCLKKVARCSLITDLFRSWKGLL